MTAFCANSKILQIWYISQNEMFARFVLVNAEFQTGISHVQKLPEPWFNIKMSCYQYRKSHCGNKTVARSSYLHNGISYTGKTTSLYWIRALIPDWLLSIRHSSMWNPYICKQIYGKHIQWIMLFFCHFGENPRDKNVSGNLCKTFTLWKWCINVMLIWWHSICIHNLLKKQLLYL